MVDNLCVLHELHHEIFMAQKNVFLKVWYLWMNKFKISCSRLPSSIFGMYKDIVWVGEVLTRGIIFGESH